MPFGKRTFVRGSERTVLFVFPLMLLYVAVGYRVFRGKANPAADHC
ncbi:hypothetical protein [Bradyrhizobium cosmicum]|nr:hypothetical protein [Bradyrhizobium cosmicum]